MQRFEAYEDDNSEWRWRLWAADFELIASSGEAFGSQAEALRAAAAVKGCAAAASVQSEPGLGMKAARRLRALLSGEPSDADGAILPAPRASDARLRRTPAARIARRRSGATIAFARGGGATLSTGARAWVAAPETPAV
jgi:uncharacterized protein YegP (UPF0339 family)